jgi:hypothetical protein
MNIPDNYTLRDILGCGLGCILFIPILLSPGYVAGWFTRVMNFREVTAPWRILIGLPLSVAICPIMTYWAGIGGSWTPVFALYGACFLLWLSLFAGMWGHQTLPRWLAEFRSVPRAGRIIPAVWLVIAIASLVNIQFHNRLYLSFTDYDHVTRAGIIDAISREGVKPFNPYYFPGAFSPLRYHYFWFLLCSLITQAGAPLVNAQHAIVASVVWCGWAMIALIPLYLRFFQEQTGARLRQCALAGVVLLAVTGLDIVPVALHAAVAHHVLPEMEWWNEQVVSWFGSLLWVPHHMAALITLLMGFLLTWNAAASESWQRRITGAVLGGVAFATAGGTSVYVTLVMAIFLILWALVTIVRRWWQYTVILAIAGAVSGLLVLPYLRSLTSPGTASAGAGAAGAGAAGAGAAGAGAAGAGAAGAGAAGAGAAGAGAAGAGAAGAGAAGVGGRFVYFEVRQFSPLTAITNRLHPGALSVAILRLAALPLNYFLELGFFGIVAVVYLRGLRKQTTIPAHVVAACLMAGVSVFVCTFLRSGVIAGNDLGWRGFLPAQFIMLLWAADLMAERGMRAEAQGMSFNSWWLRSSVWAPLILLGVTGTVYQLVLARTYLISSDAGISAPGYFSPVETGARALELRRAYEELENILPVTAKLQSSPEGRYFDFYSGLYANRQLVVMDSACGAVFGGDTTKCPAAYADVSGIFEGAPSETWQQVDAVCRRLSIDALIVTDLDGAWRRNGNWGSQIKPAISGHHVRVYLTGQQPG